VVKASAKSIRWHYRQCSLANRDLSLKGLDFSGEKLYLRLRKGLQFLLFTITTKRKILSRGEFVPGEPCLFATEPDGYEIEIWYELPTAVDPK